MKRSIIATILAATLLVSMAGVVSASDYGYTWDLNNNSVMYKGAHVENGSVTINASGSNVWQAENAASKDIHFEGATLTMLITTSTPTCDVQIGYCEDGGSNFVAGSSKNMIISDGLGQMDFDDVNFTVLQGKYLALNVTNTGSAQLTVVTDGASELWYCGLAAYPAPEFATIALVGIGLIGLVALGRRRT